MGARGRRLAVAAAVAAVVTGGVVGAGIARSPGPSTTRTPADSSASPTTPRETPLSAVRLDDVVPAREPFCRRIPEAAVTAAVGADPQESEYASGDRTTLEPGLTDVAHEFGCAFSNGQDVARVWVFAAPVTTDTATRLVTAAEKDRGCRPAGVLRFGDQGAVLLCRTATARVLRAVGRLGDSWVHCELSDARSSEVAELTERGQRWCADAALALG